MPPAEERYVIRGGERGYERLLLLARERWPDTQALFLRAGLAPGMRCVDVGCGGGAVTLEMARIVGPSGHLVGVDMDPVKLELARGEASARHLANLEFRVQNVNEWNETAAYDAVFCRNLLQHLSRPIELVRRMWAAVRPGGLLMVEDADFDGVCSDPPNQGLAFFLHAFAEVMHRNGGDPTAGRKLPRYFREAGVPEPETTVVQRLHFADEGKSLMVSTLEATSDAMLASGVAERPEIDEAIADLSAFTQDPTTMILGPRIFQIWARRSAAP